MCSLFRFSFSLLSLPLSISSHNFLSHWHRSPFQFPHFLLFKKKIKITMNTTSTTTASSSSSSEQCESGWTLYLDYSTKFHNNGAKSHHHPHHQIPCCEVHGDRFYNHHDNDEDDDEEEDLSMVSDASSGPPHLEAEGPEDIFRYGGVGGRKRGTSSEISRNVKLGRRRFERDDFALDDTASSHPMMNVILSSKKNGGVENEASPIKGLIDYSSQGFSATHFQVVVESRKRR